MSYADIRPGDDVSYAPPRGNVLLLSCMDLRLTDNIVHFMNHDNLENRYDHVIFAGAAIGALGAPGVENDKYEPWKEVFFQHLEAAIALHEIKDVYILEHRDCGAYEKVFKVIEKPFGDSKKERKEEERLHLQYARMLEKAIRERIDKGVKVHKFLMGLRGEVTVLGRSPKKKALKNGKG